MNKVIILLITCLCIFCQSCINDDIDASEDGTNYGLNLSDEGMLLDGGRISDISLYCIEKNDTTIGELWYEYYPKVKTVKDYNSFELYLRLNRNAYVYNSDNKEEMSSIIEIELEYERERSQFIYDSYKEYLQKASARWPELFTAFINGEASITCDKILYGEKPGTNLISYFSVFAESPCIPIGVESPRFLYDYGEDIPTEAAKLFINGTWLQPKYVLEFSKKPNEKYDELTLCITLPIKKEHTRNIAVSKYRGTSFKQKYSENVFSSKCLIKFNWD